MSFTSSKTAELAYPVNSVWDHWNDVLTGRDSPTGFGLSHYMVRPLEDERSLRSGAETTAYTVNHHDYRATIDEWSPYAKRLQLSVYMEDRMRKTRSISLRLREGDKPNTSHLDITFKQYHNGFVRWLVLNFSARRFFCAVLP